MQNMVHSSGCLCRVNVRLITLFQSLGEYDNFVYKNQFSKQSTINGIVDWKAHCTKLNLVQIWFLYKVHTIRTREGHSVCMICYIGIYISQIYGEKMNQNILWSREGPKKQ